MCWNYNLTSDNRSSILIKIAVSTIAVLLCIANVCNKKLMQATNYGKSTEKCLKFVLILDL